jgi:hypothetical protein
MNDINEIEKQLQGLQREITNLKKDKSTTWEEREGKEYRRKYIREKYDIVKTHLQKGTKPILLKEFKKDGFDSMAAGLNYLITEYLKSKGIEERED